MNTCLTCPPLHWDGVEPNAMGVCELVSFGGESRTGKAQAVSDDRLPVRIHLTRETYGCTLHEPEDDAS